MAEHSPTRWFAIEDTEDCCWIVKPSDDPETWIYFHDEQQAKRLVRAVNMHDELVAGIRLSLDELHSWAESEGWLHSYETDGTVVALKALLAKAKGE